MAALVAFGLYRRMRPRRVSEGRLIVVTVLIALVSVLSFFGAGRLPHHELAVAVAPLFAAAGFVAGWLMVRTMTFWSPREGELWMRGGATYLAVFLATLVLRYAVHYAATGTLFAGGPATAEAIAREASVPAPIAIVSADLLFFSAGLWIGRAYPILRRHRRFQAGLSGS